MQISGRATCEPVRRPKLHCGEGRGEGSDAFRGKLANWGSTLHGIEAEEGCGGTERSLLTLSCILFATLLKAGLEPRKGKKSFFPFCCPHLPSAPKMQNLVGTICVGTQLRGREELNTPAGEEHSLS